MHKCYQHIEAGSTIVLLLLCTRGFLGALSKVPALELQLPLDPDAHFTEDLEKLCLTLAVCYFHPRAGSALFLVRMTERAKVLLDDWCHSCNRDDTVPATWPLIASQGMTPLNTLWLLGGHAAVFTTASPCEAYLGPFHCLTSHPVPILALSQTHANNGQND